MNFNTILYRFELDYLSFRPASLCGVYLTFKDTGLPENIRTQQLTLFRYMILSYLHNCILFLRM